MCLYQGESLKLVGRELANYKYNLDEVGIQDMWEKGDTESVGNYKFFSIKEIIIINYSSPFYTQVMRSEVKRAEFIIPR